ncbi:MAG: hypothetical protein QOI20_2696 [Acidimicrobiaceae bacterium]|jgi:threonine/homoserine/homoserine lactone efflux protein|nr:hypothetical protein [Acidimicrobiaceae bacterium]
MPSPSTLLVFAGAAALLLVIPGPAVLYITTRSVSQGRAAGLASVLGVHTGSLVHIAAATAGLSAVLVSSAAAYHTVKYAGAAYLLWLGGQRLLRRDDSARGAVGAIPAQSLKRIYGQGIVVNVLNPKTALFFFAFLPQFVDPARGSVAAQALVLGLLFMALGMVSDSAYALASAALAQRLRARERRIRIVSGWIYIGLGLAAATGSYRAASPSAS